MLKTNTAERDIYIFSIPSHRFEGYYPSTIINAVPMSLPNMFDLSITKIHPISCLGTIHAIPQK
jgi:hypothetical protein